MEISTSTPTSPGAFSMADLEAYDPHGGRGGLEKLYRCPVCQSGERALHLNAETGLWNCKRASCGAKGKLTDKWEPRTPQNRQKRTQAALAAAFSIGAPQPAREVATAQEWREVYEACAPISGTAAGRYLQGRDIDTPIAMQAGVLSGHRSDRPACVFPFTNESGEPCAVALRFVDGQPKGHRTLGPRSDGVFLTTPDALKSPTVFLTEAPIDALSLAACGFPAVALGGTSAPPWLPAKLGFKRVILALDNDANTAGDKASEALRTELQKYGASAARLAPYRDEAETKSDWNHMLCKHGPSALCAFLSARLAHMEYFEFRSPL